MHTRNVVDVAGVFLLKEGEITSMSYGIVRIQKFTVGSVRGIEIHDKRVKDGVSHTNKDIDWQRTKENYTLHSIKDKNFYVAVKERIAELRLPRAVRKDAIVMAQVLVTSDRGFFDVISAEQQRNFFKDSLEYIKKRYGAKNIISATVHMDEKTPHMHVNFVPITTDGRLSAKSIFTRQHFIENHDRFFEAVGSKYGLQRGERGGEKAHYNMAEYKALTAAQEAQSKLEELRAESEKTARIAENEKAKVTALTDMKNAVQSELSVLQEAQIYLDKIPEGKPSRIGDNITFTKNEADALKKDAKARWAAETRAAAAEKKSNELESSASLKENRRLHQENDRYVDTIVKLTKKSKRADERLAALSQRLPEENPAIKAIELIRQDKDPFANQQRTRRLDISH